MAIMEKFTIGIITVLSLSSPSMFTISESKSACPLWHVKQTGKCKCVADLKGHIECHKDFLLVYNIMCLTWDNTTDSLHAGYCLYIPINYALTNTLLNMCLHELITKTVLDLCLYNITPVGSIFIAQGHCWYTRLWHCMCNTASLGTSRLLVRYRIHNNNS